MTTRPNGANPNDLFANMSDKEKVAYAEYAKAVTQTNQENALNDVVIPLASQIATEGAKVAGLVQTVKDNPAFTTLAGIQLMRETKNLTADSLALAQQFKDATTGANLWIELLKKDKEAKAFMQKYPVEQ